MPDPVDSPAAPSEIPLSWVLTLTGVLALMFTLTDLQDIRSEHGDLVDITLAVIGNLILAAIVVARGLFKTHAVSPGHRGQPHIKLAVINGVVIWTLLFVLAGLAGEPFSWWKVLLLITLGQFCPVILGVVLGLIIQFADWYPLRRTRAGLIRFEGLFLLALALSLGGGGLLYTYEHSAPWLKGFGFAGVFLIWLAVAYFWRVAEAPEQE